MHEWGFLRDERASGGAEHERRLSWIGWKEGPRLLERQGGGSTAVWVMPRLIPIIAPCLVTQCVPLVTVNSAASVRGSAGWDQRAAARRHRAEVLVRTPGHLRRRGRVLTERPAALARGDVEQGHCVD